nr:reverse transcriptase domain-containing protein [Tanacetum cinerariifolium]
MSAMANVTPIIATVKNASVKEKTLKETDAAPKASILDLCEEHYEDILPIIWDRARHDKRKEVQTTLDFVEIPMKSVHERLSNTYSPSITKSEPSEASSRDPSYSRGRSLSRDHHQIRDRLCGIQEPYDDTYSSHGTRTKCRDRTRDRNHSSSMKRRKESESPPPHGSKSSTSNRGRWKSKAKRCKPADEEDLSVPWTCEDVDPFKSQIRNFKSSRKTRMSNNVKTYDGTTDREDHLKIFQAAAQGSNKFNPLTRTPKEIFAPESGKFKPPPPMVTPVEKRSSNKFLQTPGSGSSILLAVGIPSTGSGNLYCQWELSPGSGNALSILFPTELRVTRQEVTQSFAHVKEIMFPPLTANKGTEGPLIIEAKIGGHAVHRIYVDRGSSMEVLYEHYFNRLWSEIKSQMVLTTTSLVGFSGETIWPLRQLRLLVTIGDAQHYTKAWMNFMIVRSPSPYNNIIGRPGIREIQAVPSTAHGMLKFPVDGRIVTIRSTILTPTECATIAATPKDSAKKAEARYENFKVAIHPDFPNQEITIRGTVSTKSRIIDSTSEKDIPMSDRKKRAGPGVRQGNLNRDLNKAYSQDCYPILEIDWKVESLCGYPFKCFLDAYKGYHQIQMAEQDEEKEAFHTSHGVYCYTKMPFSLKNAGITYQRLVDKAFDRQIAEGMFLGYMISPEGIELCPDKTEAVLQLPSTRTIKEILPDFLVEKPDDALPKASVIETPQEPWTLFTNGSSCVDGLGDGLILTSPEGTKFTYALRFQFTASNKEVEYDALIVGLGIATQIGCAMCTRSFLKPWLRCVRPLQANYVIREIHEGSCSMYAGPRSVVAKAMQFGYYWPTMHRDAREMIHKWINIAGPFPKGPRKVKFLIVTMDYFTKWIEAKAVATISGSQRFASVKHLQSNGLIERENRSLGKGIKARLGEGNKNWLEELPYVLWAHRTMIKSSNDDTLFSLTYGTEAIIHAEIEMPTYRTMVFLVDVVHNDEELRLNLDLLEERRERAAIREAKAKLKMTKYYNARVRGVTFRPRDFVYRSNDASHAVDGGKLDRKWEGPYEVTEALGDGAYKLRSIDGTVLSRTWNIANLKKCYVCATDHAWMNSQYS